MFYILYSYSYFVLVSIAMKRTASHYKAVAICSEESKLVLTYDLDLDLDLRKEQSPCAVLLHCGYMMMFELWVESSSIQKINGLRLLLLASQ